MNTNRTIRTMKKGFEIYRTSLKSTTFIFRFFITGMFRKMATHYVCLIPRLAFDPTDCGDLCRVQNYDRNHLYGTVLNCCCSRDQNLLEEISCSSVLVEGQMRPMGFDFNHETPRTNQAKRGATDRSQENREYPISAGNHRRRICRRCIVEY